MARKTGKDTKIEVEVGTVFYPFNELTTVSSPVADVGKKFATSATYISDQEDLQPQVRLDGVITGFVITPGSSNNQVQVSAGELYLAGVSISVTAVDVDDIIRPLVSGQVRVTALTVDSSGNINKTRGTEGSTSATRGAAGGPPFLPINEILIGYITASYYQGSASGATTITTAEINSESKERSFIPSAKIIYHDGDSNNYAGENVGVVELGTVLPLIHAAVVAGPGTNRRRVYAQYHDAEFEEIPDSKDYSFNDDIGTVKSKAYQDLAEETSLTTPMWSGAGSNYWEDIDDLLELIKNTKRWVKFYPDKDETAHKSGRAVIKVSKTMPLEDTMSASITLEGSGQLYKKAS